MAADAAPRAQPVASSLRPRRGFALFVAVIVIAVVAVLATVVTVTLSGDNDQDRIEKVADVLHRLVTAMDTTRTSVGASYGGSIGLGNYPLYLYELTHRISTADHNCSGGAGGTGYSSANAAKWRGPYFLAPISPTDPFPIAPGFVANNMLVKVSTGDLAIQMDNVSLADAKALELSVEQTNAGAGPVVTFSTATDPTSVLYHLLTPGIKICN